MSTKENTLQLPPQFSSTSSSESEPETEYSSFKKRGKHHKENEIPRKRKIKSLNGKFWFLFHFLKVVQLTKRPCDNDGYLGCYVS